MEDKTILVTGGSSGIGKAIAKKLIQEGAKVIIFDVDKPDYNVEYYKIDVSNEEQIQKAFLQIKELNVLVNNAGIYFQNSVEETKKEELDRIIALNFNGVYLMCKHALPLIKKSKGNIINISSSLGIAPEPESPAYCSTKAAIIMLTKCMSQEYASQGIRVNAILPGPIDTPLLRKAFPTEKRFKEYEKTNLMRRVGKPEEVANAALFLASDNASYVTGGLYSVDGGESVSSVYSK